MTSFPQLELGAGKLAHDVLDADAREPSSDRADEIEQTQASWSDGPRSPGHFVEGAGWHRSVDHLSGSANRFGQPRRQQVRLPMSTIMQTAELQIGRSRRSRWRPSASPNEGF